MKVLKLTSTICDGLPVPLAPPIDVPLQDAPCAFALAVATLDRLLHRLFSCSMALSVRLLASLLSFLTAAILAQL
jgi:hypothetical protein